MVQKITIDDVKIYHKFQYSPLTVLAMSANTLQIYIKKYLLLCHLFEPSEGYYHP